MLQRFATEGLAASSDWLRRRAYTPGCSRTLQPVSHSVLKRALKADVRPDLKPPRGLEVVTCGAIADVELVADDRKPHRVRAEQELAVFDGMGAEVGGESGRAAAVPARAMTKLRLWVGGGNGHFACWGT